MPFQGHLNRLLQDSTAAAAYDGCDVDLYTTVNFTAQSRLWPVWKIDDADVPAGSSPTALDPQAVFDICTAEDETMRVLQAEGLCFGCNDGSCMPPYSIVLYARLLIPGGADMTCAELRDA